NKLILFQKGKPFFGKHQYTFAFVLFIFRDFHKKQQSGKRNKETADTTAITPFSPVNALAIF
ncbi:hypothetical protein, partial [Faecalibaculum rodentium]|uniref:hypothetical protein n=1 Tax=Faecalibaculum rodentium TaxID=1702221 RepID=UPI0025A298D0